MDRARTTALASSSSQETQRMVFSVSDEKDMEIPAAFQDVIKNHAATCRGNHIIAYTRVDDIPSCSCVD